MTEAERQGIDRNLKFDLKDPKIQKEFDKLCLIQSTLHECAAWFDCDAKTIETRCEQHFGMKFFEIYRQKKGKGKVSLRRTMFQKALDGNVTMMIWLSKNYMVMSDRVMNVDAPAERYDEPEYLRGDGNDGNRSD